MVVAWCPHSVFLDPLLQMIALSFVLGTSPNRILGLKFFRQYWLWLSPSVGCATQHPTNLCLNAPRDELLTTSHTTWLSQSCIQLYIALPDCTPWDVPISPKSAHWHSSTPESFIGHLVSTMLY